MRGLPLKRFGSWRAKLRGEILRMAGELHYRRGGSSKLILKHRPGAPKSPYISSGPSCDTGQLRNFGVADKRRIVGEACSPVPSVSGVAEKYGISPRLLFQWKKDLMPDPQTGPVFTKVKLTKGPASDVALPALPTARVSDLLCICDLVHAS